MKLAAEMRVSIDVAEERAMSCLSFFIPKRASAVADSIWPEHKMTGQGSGAAASRVLKRLEKQGKVCWTYRPGSSWGWIKLKEQ